MLLEVKELTIEFHDHDIPERVVDNVSFTLDKGEILGVVGESGSGKSMTAMAIAGLLPRKKLNSTGEILFNGDELLTIERKKLRELQGQAISVIFQEPMTALNPTMTIGKQVEEGLLLHSKLTKEERKAKAIEVLGNVELENPEIIYDSYPHELSGGMRQRVMIAAAMITEPDLLIADEPTTALDVTVQSQIIDLLRRINRKKKTAILFISHDLSLINQISDKVLVMHKGRVVESGTCHDIFENPREEYTRKLISAIPRVGLN